MTKAELREKLAAVHHDWWRGWEEHREEFNTMHMAAIWRDQRDTPYADLDEGVKEFSRIEADKALEFIWPLIGDAAGRGVEATIEALAKVAKER